MPVYNISVKEGGTQKHLDKAKKDVIDQGGKIKHEFRIIKGFTAEFPEDCVHTLKSTDDYTVEADKEMKIM